MTDGIRFSPDILSRLGEELVPESDQGVIELVKNAYDADATWCRIALNDIHSSSGSILVSDDGAGMTAGMIRNGWLVIGRSGKHRKSQTEYYRRIPAGDKGLGRLAALRLGRRVHLRTRPRAEPGREYSLVIDWDAFANAEHVEDIAIDLHSSSTTERHGTEIEILQVSGKFTRTNVNKLARNLLLLSDPFRGVYQLNDRGAIIADRSSNRTALSKDYGDPGFKAELLTREFADLQTKVARSYFEEAEYRINAELSGNGTALFRMLDWRGNVLLQEQSPSMYDTLPLTFDLWVFILDSKSFSTRTSTISEVREWLSNVGGVHIYQDGIRVPPYGSQGNDWLDMNLRRARSPEGRPSTNTSVGRVALSNVQGALAQKTDRLGYIENHAFVEVRRCCSDALNWAARIKIRERDQQRQAEKEAARRSTKKATAQLDAVLNASVGDTDRKRVDEAIARYVKESGRENQSLRDELQLYRSLATAGMTSSVFAHEIGRPLQLIDEGIKGLQRLIPANKKSLAEKRISRISSAKVRLNSFVSIPLTLLAKRKRRSGRVSVNKCVLQLSKLLEPITGYFEVTMELDLAKQYSDINGSEALIDGISLNLIINALNAFQRQNVTQNDRRIRIASSYDDDHVCLIVEDNAGGIEGVDLKDIWLPGVTTSPDGTGFGLTIVRDSVADLAGSVEAIALTEFGGAKFVVKLPAMQSLF